MHSIITLTALLLLTIAPEVPASQPTKQQQPMKYYYCEYCGQKFTDVRQLTAISCARHPNGANKGKHKLYEGSEKSRYTCKYCGQQFASIQQMTGISCPRHPNGSNKGKHSPAL